MPRTAPSSPRRYVFLGAIVLAAILAWSGFWFYAAGRLDTEIARRTELFRPAGIDITCSDRAVAGYPFRMEVACPGLSLGLPEGVFVDAGPTRAVALVYNPRQLILEADGPLSVRDQAGNALSARWNLAQASARLGTQGVLSTALSVAGLEATGDITLGNAPVSQALAASLFEVHLRRSPDTAGAADLAVTFADLALRGPLQTTEPMDAAVLLTLPGAEEVLAGRAAAYAGRVAGGAHPVMVRELRLSRGATVLRASGRLQADDTGAVSGSLDLKVTEPDGVAGLLAPFYPPNSPIPTSFQGILAGFGTWSEDEGRQVVSATLTVDRGRLTIGVLPVGIVPPLM